MLALDTQHLHAGKQGCLVNALIPIGTPSADDTPLVPGRYKALPGIPLLRWQLIDAIRRVAVWRICAVGSACLVWIDSEQGPLLAQLCVLLLCRLLSRAGG